MQGDEGHVYLIPVSTPIRPLRNMPPLPPPGRGRTPPPAGAATPILTQREEDSLNELWALLGLLFLVGGFLAGRSAPFMALGMGLLLILLVGRWWRNNALRGVSYQRHFDRTHVFPGETITMTLAVQNDKQLPLTWLQFFDVLPFPPETGTRLNHIIAEILNETTRRFTLKTAYSMQSHERVQRNLIFRVQRRGYYRLGPVRYQSGDLFTLFTIDRLHDDRATLVVYPQLWPLEELALPAKELFGELKTRRSLFTDPIKTQGTRDYQPQDRFRDVHWKATARRGYLQSKVYDPSTGMTVVLFLNVATTAEFWLGQNPEQLERAVSVVASVANYSAQQKWSVGVYANGAVPGSDQPIRVRPGRAPDQLLRVLEALAAVAEFPVIPLPRLLQQESPRLPWAATFVVVTALVNEPLLLAIMQLRRSGRRVTLISLAGEAPPYLDGVLTYHIPPTLPAFQKGFPGRTATEAALHTIFTTEPVTLALEQVSND